MNIVYLNGDFVSKEKATVSVFDRAFLFGDGIYEVVPIYQGRPFGLDEHLDRLEVSLNAVLIPNPFSKDQWKEKFKELLLKNHLERADSSLYLQITRGAGDKRTHHFDKNMKPNVLIMCKTLETKPQDLMIKGFRAMTGEDRRRQDCYIKAVSLLPNILMYQHAYQNDAIETILIRDGFVTEATSSNAFIVKNNTIFTTPLSKNILAGITRHFVIKFAKELNLPLKEERISENSLKNADEVWITGSNKEVCPIVCLDDQLINNGVVGSIWHKINAVYQQMKKKNSLL